ncbi:peptidoglycan-binding domain-containing protein [Luteimicrobium subarcticum]|uniref:Peptidoglycan hydrolase-like protein with peptidoglycan-binding domain n=1 Tax=Luteimicrobium subarcticum TaxID=620910 RepID=A0A2M8W412_9MICO|nr:peptidoglycan-binding protein [Luteimicrobium subarcticum]PJI85666.1 peptidoglycan hydrolase-like protein with peptidoglycan-binding domain [Luteimicrobium subarcticum]
MSVPSTIQQGATGDDVRWLQYCLVRLTLEYRDVDGVFGARTKDAVEEFQAAEGLTVDGIVGHSTWTRLRGGDRRPPVLSGGAEGTVVKALQTTLNQGRGELTPPGTAVLATDGVFGPATAHTVQAAQQVAGVPHDGVVGLQTWALPLHALGAVLAGACAVREPGVTA